MAFKRDPYQRMHFILALCYRLVCCLCSAITRQTPVGSITDFYDTAVNYFPIHLLVPIRINNGDCLLCQKMYKFADFFSQYLLDLVHDCSTVAKNERKAVPMVLI